MWVEELEREYLRLCNLLENDNPDEQTLTFAALTPQPDGSYTLRMPTTFGCAPRTEPQCRPIMQGNPKLP